MLRATVGTTLALLGALGAIAAGTLTAQASPSGTSADTFYVSSSYFLSGSPDQLTVIVESPSSTISSLTASVMSGTTDELDVPLTQTIGPGQTGLSWWAGTIPAGTSPTGLALGSYTVNVTAVFSDSTTPVTMASPDTLNFFAQSAVTLAANPTTVGYPNISSQLSGTVTLTNPDGTADTDYSGLVVTIEPPGGPAIETLPVASDGTFSDPSFAPSAGGYIVAEIVDPGIQWSESAGLILNLTDPVQHLTLTANPVTETGGQGVTVTGTLTYVPGSTVEPLAGQKVFVAQASNGSSPLAIGTTGTDGSFSITLPALQAGIMYAWVGTYGAYGLPAISTELEVDVVVPTVISDFKVSLNQYWGLSVSGCLGFESGNTAVRFSSTSGLVVQYASSASGPWKRLGAINGNEHDYACGTGGIKFTGSFTAPENYAYYRVVYGGTSNAHPTTYASTASPSVLAWRYYDRITGLKVSPTVVNAGGKLTISGTLQYYYSGWHNYSGQVIYIDFHPKGSSSSWYWIVRVKTNSKGQFSATFKDPVSATWQAAFFGNNSNGVGHLSVGSAEVYVRLK